MRSQPLDAAVRRDRVLIVGCILIVTALAWAYLVHLHRGMSAAGESHAMMMQMGMVMDASWGATDLLLTFVMWAVMMVGMMSPSAAPVLYLFSRMQSQGAERGIPRKVLVFGLGYIVVWSAFSVVATLAQWALHQAALLSPAMATSSSTLAGTILIAAGVYQLTPTKISCLAQCQNPLGFLLSNWRDGARGAMRMGLRHGRYCLGCCWALMGVLFAVGIMNLAWVGVLTAFILLERVGRVGVYVARAGGLLLIAFGIFTIAT